MLTLDWQPGLLNYMINRQPFARSGLRSAAATGFALLALSAMTACGTKAAPQPSNARSTSASTAGSTSPGMGPASLTTVCPTVSSIMGSMPATPTQAQAGQIANELQQVSEHADPQAQAALAPMIAGMRQAALSGYSADAFRSAAMSFAAACRSASAAAPAR